MSSKGLKLRILVENRVGREGLLAEHGLSYLITYKDKEYIFDTGQGLALAHNLNKLAINVADIDGVLLSHGHYDHCNGLKDLLCFNPQLKVYGHQDIFIPKYSQKKRGLRARGIREARAEVKNFIPTREVREIYSGMFLTGEIPVTNSKELIPEKFKKKVDGILIQDDFIDEQAVFIEGEDDLVVLLACTHRGVMNTLEYIKRIRAGKRIEAIIGGMHLVNAKQDQIEEVIDYLATLEFRTLVPLHCTGVKAIEMMQKKFGDRVRLAQVGDELIL